MREFNVLYFPLVVAIGGGDRAVLKAGDCGFCCSLIFVFVFVFKFKFKLEPRSCCVCVTGLNEYLDDDICGLLLLNCFTLFMFNLFALVCCYCDCICDCVWVWVLIWGWGWVFMTAADDTGLRLLLLDTTFRWKFAINFELFPLIMFV